MEANAYINVYLTIYLPYIAFTLYNLIYSTNEVD